MRLISKDKVFSLHPLPDGFLYSYLVEQVDEQVKVGYKMVSFSGGKISNVPKSIYMLTKFGNAYKSFMGKIKNYLTCFALPLERREPTVPALISISFAISFMECP